MTTDCPMSRPYCACLAARQVHFMRLITPSGSAGETYSSQYKINDRAVRCAALR